jgi:hypothetical protein
LILAYILIGRFLLPNHLLSATQQYSEIFSSIEILVVSGA